MSKLSLNGGRYEYWSARIRVGGKDLRLGSFPFTEEGFAKAVQARRNGEERYGFK